MSPAPVAVTDKLTEAPAPKTPPVETSVITGGGAATFNFNVYNGVDAPVRLLFSQPLMVMLNDPAAVGRPVIDETGEP